MNEHNSKYTRSKMNTTPNRHNFEQHTPEKTQFQSNTVPNRHYTECIQCRMDTQCRMDIIENRHEWTRSRNPFRSGLCFLGSRTESVMKFFMFEYNLFADFE